MGQLITGSQQSGAALSPCLQPPIDGKIHVGP